jgi:predicted secreted hydrolase
MRKRTRAIRWIFLPLLAVTAVALAWALWPHGRQPLQASLVAAAVPESSAGYTRATAGRTLTFPADYGPHNDFQTEWWYYTGNLTAANGEHFGYQLTFFRRALQSPAQQVARLSAWATEQVYLAHFALTDVAGGKHDVFERLERGAARLAGAQASPYHVWLDNWSVTEGQDGQVLMRAAAGDVAVELNLSDLKGPVLQGDHGYSRKGADPGNASYYYSLTRLATHGTVTARGQTRTVDGFSWMDHEFSTSALDPGIVGWDWFSLQLNNGSELMVYGLRQSDGRLGTFSSGMLVNPDGSTRTLGPQDFSFEATGRWKSPHTGATYPSGWSLQVPSANFELTISPYLADQEMNVSFAYWEGAVRLSGLVAGQLVTGNGYVELTGYAGSLGGRF